MDVRIAKSCFHLVTLVVHTDHGSSTAVELMASYGFWFRIGQQFKRGGIEGPKEHTKVCNVEYFDKKRFQTAHHQAIQVINYK